EKKRMQLTLIQSKLLDKNDVFQQLFKAVSNFSQERYAALHPMIFEQDIPTIQLHIAEGKFTYEDLTLYYLKRIYTYELDPEKTLHTIIALNPDVLGQARSRDKFRKKAMKHPIFGMPILLKDNINMTQMPATAGAAIMTGVESSNNAFIVSKLIDNGALILGKVNLSEWAYYFCSGCPVGYSAVGGQTLNPYGRGVFETGGSSAGSGTSIAANYAVAAVGTETAGSILSPSAQNSIVGLKPTIGILSRSGIVPISHTLDTPGPMTKNVIDNAILLDAMAGRDFDDDATKPKMTSYFIEGKNENLQGKRLGVIKDLMNNTIYAETIKKLEANGATLVPLDLPEKSLNGFMTLLNLEMKDDLPKYIREYTRSSNKITSVQDIIAFNLKDSVLLMPYGQGRLEGIMADTTAIEVFEKIRQTLLIDGNAYFQEPMVTNTLDAILSINNYHAAFAAVGLHPCLALPMGYEPSGEPIAITLISSPNSEKELLALGYSIENTLNARITPLDYVD
ncbi:MAG: amidase, partial [Candidatus Latescibacterota bacterium]